MGKSCLIVRIYIIYIVIIPEDLVVGRSRRGVVGADEMAVGTSFHRVLPVFHGTLSKILRKPFCRCRIVVLLEVAVCDAV